MEICACECSDIRAPSKKFKQDRHQQEPGSAIILDPNPENEVELPDTMDYAKLKRKKRTKLLRRPIKSADPYWERERNYDGERYYREMETTLK